MGFEQLMHAAVLAGAAAMLFNSGLSRADDHDRPRGYDGYHKKQELIVQDSAGSLYYQRTLDAIHNDSDMMVTLDLLAKDVGILGIFSDWPGTEKTIIWADWQATRYHQTPRRAWSSIWWRSCGSLHNS